MDKYQILGIVLFTLILLAENFFPYRKHYKHRMRHYGRNTVLSAVNGLIMGLSGAYITVHVFLWVAENKIGMLNQFEASFVIKAILAFLIFDAWTYFWHRINHVIPFLWRFHRVHHNDPAMDVSTALRFHPIEILLSAIINLGIIAAFGIRLEHLIVYKLIFHTNVFFHHSNVAISDSVDKMLRYIIVTPNMHKVHHSCKQEETDSNFASILSWWDRLFGSYCERDPKSIIFGLDSYMEERWQTVKGLFKLPFAGPCKKKEDNG